MAEEEKTIDYSKYEKARMIGSRALQIAMGAPFLVKLSEEDLERIQFSPLEIARIEFDEGIIPITVRRPLPAKRVSS
jgi:DNA-directed RNA polymerase subunit K/omega